MLIEVFARFVRFAIVILLACNFAGCGGGGSNSGGGSGNSSSDTADDESRAQYSAAASGLTGLDRDAFDFVQARINEHWLKTADGWTTKLQVRNGFGQPLPGVPEVLFKQYRDLKFFIRPEHLSESQKLNGADYRAAVEFKNTPVRFYRPQATIIDPQGWSRWEDGSPGGALAVERRNGQWLIGASGMFEDLKPDAASLPVK